MDRPYTTGSEGLIHRDDGCRLIETVHGDASTEGVVQGILEHGEVPCPACVSEEDRFAQMDAALKRRGGE